MLSNIKDKIGYVLFIIVSPSHIISHIAGSQQVVFFLIGKN